MGDGMKTNLLKRARAMFSSEYAPRELQRRNIRAWVTSVRHLGPRWLLANKVQKVTQ